MEGKKCWWGLAGYRGTSILFKACLRRRLHETRVDSSWDEFIPATIEMIHPAYMTGETRPVKISSRDEISY